MSDKFATDTIVTNKNYVADFKYDMELNRILLKMIGAWPSDPRRSTNIDRTVAALAKLVTIFFLLFLMIPIGCHLLFVEKNWSVKIQLLVTFSYCFEAAVKYGIAIVRNDEIRCCIDVIVADWREVESKVYRSIMIENARTCRVFTKLFVTANYSCLVTYHFIVPFVSDGSSSFQNNVTKIAPVLYGTEFFIFDPRISPMREIVYLGQTLGAMAMCTVNCAISTTTVKFAMHACNRYRIVTASMQFADGAVDNDDKVVKRRNYERRSFGHIVQRHLHAIEFVHRIEIALNEICFVSLAVSTVNMCFIGYTLIVEWEKSAPGNIATYVFAAMSLVSNIFVLCYCGEQLAEQCRRVSTAGYMTNWWSMQPRESRALILIIVMAQLPVEFSAGKLFKLSLTTFCVVMKMAITYLNVLRTMIRLNDGTSNNK